jgi:hypothetical protein
MLRTVAYSQLDSASKSYLRSVRQAGGRGMPGVFQATPDSRALLAFVLGLVILPLFLWLGYGTNKAAWAMALLQTAGVMLGGWLMLYAVRRWVAGMDNYAGKFVYFDPEHVFVGQGEELKYARLDEDTEAVPDGDTAVKLRTEAGTFSVPVPSRVIANFVADYYDALGHLREGASENWWRNVTAAELGAMARFMVVNERVPGGTDEIALNVGDLPEEVRPARGKPSGLLRYLLILAIGGFVYTGFLFTNKPLHDAAAFGGVNQTSPAELRHYLADPNTEARHDEAKQKLKDLYAVKHKELAARPALEAELRDAFLGLFDTLDGPEPPAVSIHVAEATGDPTGTTWANSLRTRLADGIGTEVGKEYILFVEKPKEEGKWAMFDLRYSVLPSGQLTWTLDFRRQATDEKPYATVTRVVSEVTVQASEAVYSDVMRKMLGNAPAAPPALQLDDW